MGLCLWGLRDSAEEAALQSCRPSSWSAQPAAAFQPAWVALLGLTHQEFHGENLLEKGREGRERSWPWHKTQDWSQYSAWSCWGEDSPVI